jgi:GDP-L-fucose synthase
MFFNIMRNGDHFGRFVFLSSGALYDSRKSLVRVAEDQLGGSVPEDDHGLSKYAIAQFLDARGSHWSPPVVELRLFGVFGPYEDYGIRFISNAICRTLFNLPITLRQDRRFSYLFIDDLMPILDWALAARQAHVAYNVSPDWTESLRGLGELVLARSGKGVPILVAEDGYGNEYTADSSRLQGEMPPMTFTPTDVAVDRLYSWYRDRLSEIDRTRLEIDR